APAGGRVFAALVPGLEPGLYSGTLVGGVREESVDLAVPAHSASSREQRSSTPNLALLEQAAALTGGQVAPSPGALLAARPGIVRRRGALDAVLIPLALALILVDVALRRFSAA